MDVEYMCPGNVHDAKTFANYEWTRYYRIILFQVRFIFPDKM